VTGISLFGVKNKARAFIKALAQKYSA